MKYFPWITLTDSVKDIGKGWAAGGVERGFSPVRRQLSTPSDHQIQRSC